MRNFLIAMSLVDASLLVIASLTSCARQDGEVDPNFVATAAPAIVTVNVTQLTPASCREFGELATLTITASQGEVELNQLHLNRKLDFGNDAELSWTDGRHIVVWEHAGLFPRKLEASRETERLQVRPGDPVVFTLSVDPDDCHDFGSQAIVDSVAYWDVGLKKTIVQEVAP